MTGRVRVGRVVPTGPDRPVFDSAIDRLEVVEVRQETPDLRSFTCRAASGARFRFLPGQAMTLVLPVGAAPAYRTFTIASSPTRPEHITFTVKAGEAGGATRWMHERLRPGDRLEAIGPVGRFSIAHHPAQAVALVSAGSGITPMMAMLRWLADRGERTDVAFLHQARAPEAVPFRAELDVLAAAMPSLHVALVASRVPVGQDWAGHRGRLDGGLVAQLVPDLAGREVFCCGPAGFMDAMRRILAEAGGEATRFHAETFHPAPAEPVVPGAGEHGIRLHGRAFPARAGETVVAAAARAGIVVPTGCRSGLCGTCRLRLVSGTVEMRHAGGLSAREERAGMILACCARPTSPVELRPVR